MTPALAFALGLVAMPAIGGKVATPSAPADDEALLVAASIDLLSPEGTRFVRLAETTAWSDTRVETMECEVNGTWRPAFGSSGWPADSKVGKCRQARYSILAEPSFRSAWGLEDGLVAGFLQANGAHRAHPCPLRSAIPIETWAAGGAPPDLIAPFFFISRVGFDPKRERALLGLGLRLSASTYVVAYVTFTFDGERWNLDQTIPVEAKEPLSP